MESCTKEQNVNEISILIKEFFESCSEHKAEPEIALSALLSAAEYVSSKTGIYNITVHANDKAISLVVKELPTDTVKH